MAQPATSRAAVELPAAGSVASRAPAQLRPSLLERPVVLAALLALLCLIWGSTWLAIKVGLRDMPPFFAAGTRYLVASALVCALALARGIRAPRGGRAHLGLLALGLCAFALSFGVVYWGEQYLPAG
ncbi:MAG: EamA family transporter, partial [Gemmatimonadetes bacterium]|nr:EamA family transporter [Gemmatimonadota bacterium]